MPYEYIAKNLYPDFLKPINQEEKEILNRHFTLEAIQMTNKHMKRYSTLLDIRQMPIKIKIISLNTQQVGLINKSSLTSIQCQQESPVWKVIKEEIMLVNGLQTEESSLQGKPKVHSPKTKGRPVYIEKVFTLVPD